MTGDPRPEYQALRDTIRERGTARVWIALAGLAAWAALALATAALLAFPLAAVLPLLVLAAAFESVFALHTGVERIGRYIQVFYETGEPPPGRWEHTAMAYGRVFPGGGPDPLFAAHFAGAAAANLVLVWLAEPLPIEWVIVGALHAGFVLRLWRARRDAGAQRGLDLERYRTLLAAARDRREPNGEGSVPGQAAGSADRP